MIDENPAPSYLETTLGGLLQDIGKLMQRAYGSVKVMDEAVLARESVILPSDGRGGYTHKHALWSEAFFDQLEKTCGKALAKGIRLDAVRNMAVFHHAPDKLGALGWLAAKADRYSSGMDRMPQQEWLDTGERGWDRFRRIPSRCIFDHVDIGLGKPGEQHVLPLETLKPDEDALFPLTQPQPDLPERYLHLWEGFMADCRKIATADLPPPLLEEALLGLFETYTWAVPSSTVDVPDISLYDHSKTVAAIAAVLYRWHEANGSLQNEASIRDDNLSRFRLLSGDLSGIQQSLFRLHSEGVKGVSRILRARSFLLGALAEAAALRILHELNLPLSCILQLAGGRFLMLVPALPEVESKVAELAAELDRWMLDHYCGDLAINLALGRPFAGKDFRAGTFRQVMNDVEMAVAEAKLRPLSNCRQGPLSLEYPFGPCTKCGIRPAATTEGGCRVCNQEERIGRYLPKAAWIGWGFDTTTLQAQVSVKVLGLSLSLFERLPPPSERRSLISLKMLPGHENDAELPLARHHVANYVPLIEEGETPPAHCYEEEKPEAGNVKTFCHIAETAREETINGTRRGKPFLGVLKADVDRLGLIFSCGLSRGEERFTLSRFVQLSRMMDYYFSGYLPALLSREFSDTYTVYAGGDDLLLIGPWRQTLQLAERIRETFAAYTGNNPNLTLSAGLELVHANLPLNRAVQEAEERLERSKQQGRNRFCAITDDPVPWEELPSRMALAEWCNAELRHSEKPVSTGFVYRILQLGDDAKAAREGDVSKAAWRARLGYHLARQFERNPERKYAWLEKLGLTRELAGEPDVAGWRWALSVALYRNRD